LSPDTIGIPQHRNRTFIVGSIEGLSGFDWERVSEKVDSFSLADLLDKEPEEAKFLLPLNRGYLQTWQEFLDLIPSEAPLPSFPVWAMEFGATYPFEEQHPLSMSGFDLNAYKGAMGVSLRGLSGQNLASALPKYINNCTELPTWKKRFIRQNRQFFEYHRSKLEPWLDKIREFPPSFQKFEWTWKDGPRKLSETLVQFRASGIRVKRPDRAPSLVAMTSSQVPIVAAEGRYMTVRECARLQSMEGLSELPRTETGAYRALGNAVNVKLVKRIAEELLANVDHDVADSSYRHLPESYDTLHVG
jgi:DNA (cytosine-5)-methyltransferase 1